MGGGKQTRLDGLLNLLETGTSTGVRRMAADQLGDLAAAGIGAAASSDDADATVDQSTREILRRVRAILLNSPSWDARVAAGHALAAIATVTPPWSGRKLRAFKLNTPHQQQLHQHHPFPPRSDSNTHTPLDNPPPPHEHHIHSTHRSMLRLGEFDLERVLRHGAGLFGSAGQEYDVTNVDLAQQREQLKKDLGIDDRFAARKQSSSVSRTAQDDVLGVRDEDLAVHNDLQPKAENQVAADDMVLEMQGVSARERNRLKREARKRAKAATVTGAPSKKPRKSLMQFKGEPGADNHEEQALTEDPADDPNAIDEDDDLDALAGALGQSGAWALDASCEVLKQNLLHAKWEHRHGAAIGLREILKAHPSSVGRSSTDYCPGATPDFCNAQWLEDVICRLLCVLALDRFGDFVGEGVVAPVRETAGMAIAAASKAMAADRVHTLITTLEALFRLEFSNHWEVRHGGLHSLRYLLAVRGDMASTVVPAVFPSLAQALSDIDDDVRAAAAAALQPIVSSLAELVPDQMTSLVSLLWESTLSLEDISASTGHVLGLLADLMDIPTPNGQPRFWISENTNLVELVPRLFPFLRHSSKAVRKSVLRVIEALISSEPSATQFKWIQPILQDIIGRTFRNVLLESEPDLLKTSKFLWVTVLKIASSEPRELVDTCAPKFDLWVYSASQGSRAKAAELDRDDPRKNPIKPGLVGKRRRKVVEHHTVAVEGPDEGTEMQQAAAWALGYLLSVWPEQNENAATDACERGLCSEYATTRRVTADIFRFSLLCSETKKPLLESARESLMLELGGQGGCPVAEMGTVSSSMFNDTVALLDFFKSSRVPVADHLDHAAIRDVCASGAEALKTRHYSESAVLQSELVPSATKIVTQVYEAWTLHPSSSKVAPGKREIARALRMRILSALGFFNHGKDALKSQLGAGCAATIVSSTEDVLPKAVGPFIKALLSSVRTTPSPCYQGEMAKALAELAYRLSEREAKKPLSLMVRNIVKFCVESHLLLESSTPGKSDDLESVSTEFSGTARALQEFCLRFGAELPARLPFLWSVFEALEHETTDVPRVNSLLTLRLGSKAVHTDLHQNIFGMLPSVIAFCASSNLTERREAQNCLSDVVKVSPAKGMDVVVCKLMPMLGSEQPVDTRRGAVEALSGVVKNLGQILVPYAAFLIVPTMRRMIDKAEEVRGAASEVFGSLVRMMPLEEGAPDDPTMSAKLAGEREEAREFLGQLLGTRKRQHYSMPVSIGDGVELRKYQQDCLDWLAFLNKYGLHGALCDDMGLGKTLMTLCMITASSHMLREAGGPRLPSLVACPSTLVGHWHEEAERFFGHELTNIAMYAGPPRVRAQIRTRTPFDQCDLVITSYEALGSDIQHFSDGNWDYLALDEGHVIKNSKTKVALAVRSVNASHRLILTGTPIQNSVTELWAMFDFLMPGFLGTEKAFKANYGKPITATRDPKTGDKAREQGLAAMEALHRQVLPFILRRLKDDVLQELPPKIVQDYYCSMTPTQVRLYEDFSQSMLKNEFTDPMVVEEEDDEDQKGKSGSHVFQALQYLRRLCSHPALVLTRNHPEFESITKELAAEGRHISDIDQSAKLISLRNILVECGIGVAQDDRNFTLAGGHRALIFAQTKAMLDLVEHDLFRKDLSEVTYLRMDGGVDASKRQPLVTRFNADPTIDCLLLTTHVGGLGLNLTGADTVIFLEHDWNPTKDLQAMDRAHRIGQKRTVNVYRLITRGTLEEKIMGIQKFKTHIANTVVNRDNSSLQSMNTGELLDLFKVEGAAENPSQIRDETSGADAVHDRVGKGLKSAIANVGELWDESQYAEEYDLGSFVRAIQK